MRVCFLVGNSPDTAADRTLFSVEFLPSYPGKESTSALGMNDSPSRGRRTRGHLPFGLVYQPQPSVHFRLWPSPEGLPPFPAVSPDPSVCNPRLRPSTSHSPPAMLVSPPRAVAMCTLSSNELSAPWSTIRLLRKGKRGGGGGRTKSGAERKLTSR